MHSEFGEVEMPQPGWSGLRLHFGIRKINYLSHWSHGPNRDGSLLTSFRSVDTVGAERSFVGEDRGIDRILRRLKLHAESRQFGGQSS